MLVAICIEIDGFGINDDGFCIINDDFNANIKGRGGGGGWRGGAIGAASHCVFLIIWPLFHHLFTKTGVN